MLCEHKKSLTFPEPRSKERNENLLSSPHWFLGRFEERNMFKNLENIIQGEGFLLEVIRMQRILLSIRPVFRTPLPLLKGEFWGSGRGIETSAADIRSPVPHPVKSEDYRFKQRKHHQSHMNTCSAQGFGGDHAEAPVFSSVLEGRYHNFFSNSHH